MYQARPSFRGLARPQPGHFPKIRRPKILRRIVRLPSAPRRVPFREFRETARFADTYQRIKQAPFKIFSRGGAAEQSPMPPQNSSSNLPDSFDIVNRANAEYIDQLYAQYQRDPRSVEPQWQAF